MHLQTAIVHKDHSKIANSHSYRLAAKVSGEIKVSETCDVQNSIGIYRAGQCPMQAPENRLLSSALEKKLCVVKLL